MYGDIKLFNSMKISRGTRLHYNDHILVSFCWEDLPQQSLIQKAQNLKVGLKSGFCYMMSTGLILVADWLLK